MYVSSNCLRIGHEIASCLVDEVFGSLQDAVTREYVCIDGLHQTNHHDDRSESRQYLCTAVVGAKDELE